MDANQKQAAKKFVERWQQAEGNEDREARSFLIELLQDVLGIKDPTKVLDFERRVKGRKIDAFYEDMGILLEAKSRKPGILDERRNNGAYGFETPYEQAKWYANELPSSIKPRWIIVTDFDEFRIHDLDTENPEREYISVKLEDLPEQSYLFDFFFDRSQSRLVKEKELSVEAGEIVGRLYNSLMAQYRNIETDAHEQRSLNILIVRFVFLLYAEDAGLLQEHQAFLKYMRDIAPENFRDALFQLFKVLDTPIEERDPYLNDKLAAFPYINGSLFKREDIVIPQFTEEIKEALLREASQEFDWSGISPTIFGAAFESTLNPETRRAGGMHYTSIENIHKVIDPLFLDDLKAELAKIEGERVEQKRIFLLRAFQNKLASLKIFDPACGSGNFLTESYIQLRHLENRVLANIQGDNQTSLSFEGELNPIKVSIDQFYGIEINDFAVSVAKAALWIAESQMIAETRDTVEQWIDVFPLSNISNIVEGNALRMDWNDVIPASECSYIIGNPPFLGASNCSPVQKQEIVDLYGKIKLSNSLDYVAGWYYKACEYIKETPIRCAFVSTNSITQGEQVYPIWHTLRERFDIKIDFAWTTFVWDSEASDKAHVHVVIIGFSNNSLDCGIPKLFDSHTSSSCEARSISPYLTNGSFVAVQSTAKPVTQAIPKMKNGSKPTDGGWYLFTPAEKDVFLQKEPRANKFFRPWVGSEEFINAKERWCLYLGDVDLHEIEDIPLIMERVEAVRKVRLGEGPNSKGKVASKKPPAPTQKSAETPMRFFCDNVQDEPYLIIPNVSSERRHYVPIGFMTPETIASNLVATAEHATLYDFGILTSQFHNAWMRTVAGRLEMRYRYTPGLVYNTFVWPNPTAEQKQKIEQLAQSILDIRDSYPDKSLADLYDPDKMPPDLLAAHKALDKAVEEAYGVDFDGDEEKIVAHLFKLYAEATKGE